MKNVSKPRAILSKLLAVAAIIGVTSCKKIEQEKSAPISKTNEQSQAVRTGAVGAHDPSGIVTDGSRFYTFTTGNGIYSAYSTDLIAWTAAPNPVFPLGTWPAWINSAVPGFNGHFWAPDVINMNGRWYVYYSCSTFGSSRSAIGVATSTSLSGPWTDLGMVVSSASRSDVNAIDPGLFRDTNGRVYMTYGSFSGGIGIVEINPATAKTAAGSTIVRVAGGGGADWEAPYLMKEGSYYYLFANRGACCRGTSSTYYVQVGRATSPTGPYSGWRTVLGTSGRYIGPGHFGLLRHNGSNFVSIHYYDGSDNGNAKLDILNMGFSGGWPFLTRDWVAAGTYSITNVSSGKVWDAWGCTGALGQAVAQGTWANLACQKWNFTPVGDGAYRITSLQGGRSVDVSGCNSNNGALVNVWDWLNNNCQKFRLERTSTGSHVFYPLHANRVLEVPGGSTANGTQIKLWDYNGGNWQKWTITSR